MILPRARISPYQGIRLAIGFALAGLFLYLAVGTVDTTRSINAMLHIRFEFILLGLALLALGYSIRIVRWWLLLRPINPDVPVSACARALLTGFAVNNLIPLRAGDVLRAVGFRRALGAGAGQILGTLAVERVLDLLALLVFFFIGLSQVSDDVVPASFVTVGLLVGAVALALGVLVALWPAATRRVIRRFALAPPIETRAVPRRVAGVVVQMADSLIAFESRRTALALVGLSLLIWFVEGAMFAMVILALNVDASPIAGHFSMATGTLATTIPSTPGYVGTFDLFARLGLQAFGASAAAAAAFAVTVHLVLWIPVTATGVALFLVFGTERSVSLAPLRAEETAE